MPKIPNRPQIEELLERLERYLVALHDEAYLDSSVNDARSAREDTRDARGELLDAIEQLDVE